MPQLNSPGPLQQILPAETAHCIQASEIPRYTQRNVQPRQRRNSQQVKKDLLPIQASNKPGMWGCPWFRKLSQHDRGVDKSRQPDLDSTFSSSALCCTGSCWRSQFFSISPSPEGAPRLEQAASRPMQVTAERPPRPLLALADLLGARCYGFGLLEGETVLVESS